MTFEIHVLVWDRHKNVTELNQLKSILKTLYKRKKSNEYIYNYESAKTTR